MGLGDCASGVSVALGGVAAEMQGESGEASESGPVCVWRFPQSLSQSRIGGRKRRSYACTIIALRLSQHLAALEVLTPPSSPSLSLPFLSPVK